MVLAGLYDGNVAVFNLHNKDSKPAFISTSKTGKHQGAVWQVCWQKDDLDENMNFTSISADGAVKQWALVKHELICTVRSLSFVYLNSFSLHCSYNVFFRGRDIRKQHGNYREKQPLPFFPLVHNI